jgi:hypothetical protein
MPPQDIARALPSRLACPTNMGVPRPRYSKLRIIKRGYGPKKKPRQEGWRDQHVWVSGGRLSFSLDKEVGASFAWHKAKVAYSPKATKKPGAAGRVVISLAVRKEAAAASRQASGRGCPDEQRKGPAADGASFLPRDLGLRKYRCLPPANTIPARRDRSDRSGPRGWG